MAITALSALASNLLPVTPVAAARPVRGEPLPGVPEIQSPAVDRFERSLRLPGEQATYGPPTSTAGCRECG